MCKRIQTKEKIKRYLKKMQDQFKMSMLGEDLYICWERIYACWERTHSTDFISWERRRVLPILLT